MTMFAAILAPLLLGLALLHMRKPRYETRRISAARFFDTLAPADSAQTKWQWQNPLKSPPFLLQALCLSFIAAAVFSENAIWFTVEEPGSRRLWVWVDTSSSMAATVDGQTQLDRVRAAWRSQNQRLAQQESRWLLRLTAFDAAQRDLGEDLSLDELSGQLAALQPRPLATDLTLPLRAWEQQQNQQTGGMVLVYSDQPAPAWLSQLPQQRMVWHHIGEPTANHGFSEVQALDNPFDEGGALVQITAQQVGPPLEVRLDIQDRHGTWQDNQPMTFKDGRFSTLFRPPAPGTYELELVPGDAYPADNRVVIQVEAAQAFRIDWRHPDQHWRQALGLRHQPEQASFSVVHPNQTDALPPDRARLIVGPGWTPGDARIAFFREADPLLAQVNLDVAETLTAGKPPALPPLTPVLTDMNDTPWLARGTNPPTVYLAGFPTGQGDQARLTTLLWFNAVQTLLGFRGAPPLFQRTTPTAPLVETQTPPFRLDLHPGEGPAFQPNQSYRLDLLEQTEDTPAAAAQHAVAWWPWLLSGALLFFFVERVLFLIGGPAWR